MRGRRATVYLLILAWAPSSPAREPTKSELEEPPQQFVLEVAGKSIDVRLNRPFALPEEARGTDAVLKARPHRELVLRELRFRYPAYYTFEMDNSEAITQWWFSGNDLRLALWLLKDRDPADVAGGPAAILDDLLKHMIDAFPGASKALVEDAKFTAGGRTMRGKRFTAEYGDHLQEVEILVFVASSEAFAILFLDSLDEAGRRSREGESARRLLAESLTFVGEPSGSKSDAHEHKPAAREDRR